MMIALQDDMYRDDMSQEDIISSYPLVQYPRQNISSVVDELTNYLISRKLNPIRITLPNVNDHLSIINQGGAIGILPSSVKKLINMHNYNIKLIPFVHKGEKLKVKVTLTIYVIIKMSLKKIYSHCWVIVISEL